jgi:biotin carboxyl carrier protein
MRIDVNGNPYEIEIIGNKARVNKDEIDLKLNEEGEGIMIGGKKFHLDFFEEGEPSLMIINGASYLISKTESENATIKELKAPISGQIVDVFAAAGSKVAKGQLLLVLEAMKMENQMKSPVAGMIKEVKVIKGQLVKRDETLLVFG